VIDSRNAGCRDLARGKKSARPATAGPDQAAAVVLRVDEGDEEAPGVQDLGELQQGRDVALRRVRDENGLGQRAAGVHSCFSSVWDGAEG
jgi:hypothetical protein